MPILNQNRGLQLLAFVIAVGLWLLVSGEEQPVRVYDVPLDFTLARDRMLTDSTAGEVKVRVRGPESVLRGLAAEDLRIPVDLTRVAAGSHMVQVLEATGVKGLPLGVNVESITPDRLSFAVERKVSHVIRVSPRLEGAPAPGYRMVKFDAEPASVAIEGPESDVLRVSNVYTEPIPLYGKQSSFSVAVRMAMDIPRIRLLGSGLIKVTVQIKKEDS